VPDAQADDECVPCRGNFLRYLVCLIRRLDGRLVDADLEEWLGDCHRNKECRKLIESQDCLNNATCQVAVGRRKLK